MKNALLLCLQYVVGAPGNDGNASMPEQVKRLNPWRKMMMIIQYVTACIAAMYNGDFVANSYEPQIQKRVQ